jgi:hypothetical protein
MKTGRHLIGSILFGVFLFVILSVPLLVHARRQGWPNMQVLNQFSNPHNNNDTCSIFGAADPNNPSQQEKAKSNALKNRYTLPPGGFASAQKLELTAMARLPLGPGGSAPKADAPDNKRFVYIEAFVRQGGVFNGGSSGESCNCKTKVKKLLDTHIDVVADLNAPGIAKGNGKFIVETTERSRRLAKAQLLKSVGIGTDWSVSKLKALEGRKVRFYGWLFYDPDHHTGGWRADPQDTKGEKNWRETGWEIHPVMGIEVLP